MRAAIRPGFRLQSDLSLPRGSGAGLVPLHIVPADAAFDDGCLGGDVLFWLQEKIVLTWQVKPGRTSWPSRESSSCRVKVAASGR